MSLGFVVCEGDSLTSGTKASAPQYAYPAQMELGGATVDNIGGSGEKIENTPGTEAIASLAGSGEDNRAAVLWMGINDVYAGSSAVQISGWIDDWIASVRAADPDVRIVGCTIIPSGTTDTPAMNAVREAVNTHITTAADYDRTVDLAADSRLSDPYDTTYFDVDEVHCNDTGYGVVADLVEVDLMAFGYDGFPDAPANLTLTAI